MPKFIFAIGDICDFDSQEELRSAVENGGGGNMSCFEFEAFNQEEATIMGRSAALDDWTGQDALSCCWQISGGLSQEEYYAQVMSQYATLCLEDGGDPGLLADMLRELADTLCGD